MKLKKPQGTDREVSEALRLVPLNTSTGLFGSGLAFPLINKIAVFASLWLILKFFSCQAPSCISVSKVRLPGLFGLHSGKAEFSALSDKYTGEV